jgi:hypothetical protein
MSAQKKPNYSTLYQVPSQDEKKQVESLIKKIQEKLQNDSTAQKKAAIIISEWINSKKK